MVKDQDHCCKYSKCERKKESCEKSRTGLIIIVFINI